MVMLGRGNSRSVKVGKGVGSNLVNRSILNQHLDITLHRKKKQTTIKELYMSGSTSIQLPPSSRHILL